MRTNVHSRIVAALLAPVLLLAAGAQSMLFMRCAQDVHACCRPKAQAQPTVARQLPTAIDCCAKVEADSSVPPRAGEAVAVSTPSLVALPVAAPQPVMLIARAAEPPRLQAPPGRSLVISHCSLLI